jgi:hypothetical protein
MKEGKSKKEETKRKSPGETGKISETGAKI